MRPPNLDSILSNPSFAGLYRPLVKKIALEFLEKWRNEWKNTQVENDNNTQQDSTKLEQLIADILKIYQSLTSPSLIPLINATGIALHTNLGRSVLSREILEKITPLLLSYNNLEYDLQKGQRGERYSHLKTLFCAMLDCEDVLVVNNNAASVFLVLNTFAKNKEVLISRGELIEIGGSFRIPDVMQNAQAKLVEVGTTNKTYLSDYKKALSEEVAIVMKAHKSNYSIVGFSEEVSYSSLVEFAKEEGIIDYYDLGSGFLGLNGEQFFSEPSLKEIAQLKPSLVSFSGDKLLGSTQAGIIFGKSALIAQLKKNPLLRMLRVDKITLSILQETLRAYLVGNIEAIPTASFLHQTPKDLEEKAKILAQSIPKRFNPQVIETQTFSGGGSLPNRAISSYGVSLCCALSAEKLEKKLRERHIIGRIFKDRVVLDVYALFKEDLEKITHILQDLNE